MLVGIVSGGESRCTRRYPAAFTRVSDRENLEFITSQMSFSGKPSDLLNTGPEEPTWTLWSEWSGCSFISGSRQRQRRCVSCFGRACTKCEDATFEYRNCTIDISETGSDTDCPRCPRGCRGPHGRNASRRNQANLSMRPDMLRLTKDTSHKDIEQV